MRTFSFTVVVYALVFFTVVAFAEPVEDEPVISPPIPEAEGSDKQSGISPSFSKEVKPSKSISVSKLRQAESAARQALDESTVIDLSDDIYELYATDNTTSLIELFYTYWSSKSAPMVHEFIETASRFAAQKDVRFGSINCQKTPRLCRKLSILNFPTVRIIARGDTSYPYLYSGMEYHADAIVPWIQDVLRKDRWRARALQHQKIEQERAHIPHPAPGHIVELNITNFDKFAMSTSKCTFVVFYAPWCEHCQGSLDELKKTAEYFRLDENVIIGAINADNPDNKPLAEKYKVEGYPTFMVFQKPSITKRGMRYEGGRDTLDFQAFVDTQNRYFHQEGMEEGFEQFKATMEKRRAGEDATAGVEDPIFASMPKDMMPGGQRAQGAQGRPR